MSADNWEPSVEADPEPEDWTERIPCADESCIGTVGRDGLCRVCGRKGQTPAGEAQASRADDSPAREDAGEADPAEDAVDDPEQEVGGEREEDADDLSDGGWDQRRLCPDESCIGTLGPDGHCRVCGRKDGGA